MEELRKHAPVTSLEMFQGKFYHLEFTSGLDLYIYVIMKYTHLLTFCPHAEKLEECARNVVNADTNLPMQFTVQHGFDVFLSSDTFYVEVKMNPRARKDPGDVIGGGIISFWIPFDGGVIHIDATDGHPLSHKQMTV